MEFWPGCFYKLLSRVTIASAITYVFCILGYEKHVDATKPDLSKEQKDVGCVSKLITYHKETYLALPL